MRSAWMSILVAASVTAVSDSPAAAAGLPAIDSDRYCSRVIGPDDADGMRLCLDDERTARDQLSHDWNEFSPRLQKECIATTSSADAAYVLLQECIGEKLVEGNWDDFKWK